MTKTIDKGIIESTKSERLHFFHALTQWIYIYFPSIQPNLQSICQKEQLDKICWQPLHIMLDPAALCNDKGKFVTKQSR